MEQASVLIESIIATLNTHSYENLDSYLKDLEWDVVAPLLIEPKEIRNFSKKISNKEVQLDVMQFLEKYAKQYFREAAENKEYREKVRIMQDPYRDHIKTANDYIQLFKEELLFLIDQSKNAGQFTGEKFSKLEREKKQLEEKVNKLTNEVGFLKAQIDKYEHPSAYGKHIPDELRIDAFFNIMGHLVEKKIVCQVTEPNEIGARIITCYHWYGSKALFGYFVYRMNKALNLNGARVPLNWKIFEPAINNYSDLIDEARKAHSTYISKSHLQTNRIKDVEKVDYAIENKDIRVKPNIPRIHLY